MLDKNLWAAPPRRRERCARPCAVLAQLSNAPPALVAPLPDVLVYLVHQVTLGVHIGDERHADKARFVEQSRLGAWKLTEAGYAEWRVRVR
jgi:hypothetical protein